MLLKIPAYGRTGRNRVRRRELHTAIQCGACPVMVISGNAHNDPIMSAFDPVATK
jgi:hypothetical protein